MRPVTVTTSDASGGAKSSAVVPLDIYLNPFSVSLDAQVTGTANYDIQYTEDNVFATTFNAATAHWTSMAGLTGATASGQATLVSPVSAVRILQNTGAGSVSLRITQGGAVS
jgi:hypothetical protein